MPPRPAGAARGTWLVLALLAALLLARLAGMHLLPLMDSTEARYAEIGRKMAQLGDWVTPWHDSGVPFWGKPPLSFWLTAASFRLFGTDELAARLPHFLCAAGIACCAWRLGTLRSREEGLLATALLASSALFYVSAGAVMTDAALVLGTTLAMAGFWEGLQANGRQRPQRWLLFAGAALGLLAKGPLALVLIGLPLAGWIVVTRAWARTWRAFPWVAGALLVLAVAAPWYVLAERRTPGFLDYFLIGEHWHRFVTPGWQGDRYGSAHRFPPGTIWVFAIAAALPWSLLLPAAAVFRPRRPPPAEVSPDDRDWRLYLLAWSLAPLLFFTVARNILWTYALPALPALALLGAHLLARWSPRAALGVVASGLALTLAGVLAFGAFALGTGRADDHSARTAVRLAQQHCRGWPLVWVGSRPFSAEFYTAGRAREVHEPGELAATVHGPACAVIASAGLDALRSMPELDTDVIGRAGRHVVVKVVPRRGETLALLAPGTTR